MRTVEPYCAAVRGLPVPRSPRVIGVDLPVPADIGERFRDDGIVGESVEIKRALALAERAARSRATVLLTGETGTGKDLLARAIHAHGPRAGGPFVALNCASVPEALLESELFGHTRGAFTGAERARCGLLEEASGGTFFLDEVSDASPGVQAKLLRALEESTVRPVGSNASRRIDVRLVAATNCDLRAIVCEGRFRHDLYYRLHVLPIVVPPLRERCGDVRLLALHFLRELSAQERTRVAGFSPGALRRLETYAWPGNVRELRSEIHRLVMCADDGEWITPDQLAAPIAAGGGDSAEDGLRPLREIVREVETATIRTRLRHFGYHRAVTARSLGVTREWLWVKMRRLGIEGPPQGPADGSATRRMEQR